MTWVKICGTTNLEDALVAVDAGADAVGFVFYEKSPRCVTVEAVQEIVGKLPDGVETVGVFAGASLENAVDTAHAAELDSMQMYMLTYHHPENGELQARAPGVSNNFYAAFPMAWFLGEDGKSVAGFSGERPVGMFDALFLDSGSGERPGGTGNTFDWREAAYAVKELSLHQRVVIAGGLRPDNVGGAIEILRPWGVDVVSGVEASPGKKDPERVRAFVRTVREIDRKVG